jgi:hypothetical protein
VTVCGGCQTLPDKNISESAATYHFLQYELVLGTVGPGRRFLKAGKFRNFCFDGPENPQLTR